MAKTFSELEIKQYLNTLTLNELIRHRENLRFQKKVSFGGPDKKQLIVCLTV